MKIGRFEISNDKYQWILTEYYDGRDKNGNPKMQSRENYFGTLEQVCLEIVNRDSKLADDVAGMIEAMSESARRISEACAGIRRGAIH